MPWVAIGSAIELVERTAAEVLPAGFTFEWTELALQQRLFDNTTLVAFAFSVVFTQAVCVIAYLTLPKGKFGYVARLRLTR